MTAGGQQDHGSKQDAGRQGGAGRLGSLLQDLAQTHGRVRTAQLLGVNYRTLARSLESGEMTETMQQALERYAVELPVDRDVPEDGELADDDVLTVDGPQDDELADDGPQDGVLNTDDPDEVNEAALLRQEVEALREELAQALGRYEGRLAQLEQGGAGQVQAASASLPPPESPRGGIHPQVVTVEPVGVEDEERAYRGAMPLVTEWREVRGRRERAAHTLDYLQAEERLMQLEIALAGEHRLTLPPDTYPWDGIRRHAELRLRQRVLKRVRRQRRWTWLLHWSARLLTLGLWGRKREPTNWS